MQFLPEEIEQYADLHTKGESALLSELSRETWQKVVMPRMLSGHVQGRFLSMISKLIRPKYILEIGTYTGYSALCLAEGLQEDGRLYTIDINDELQWIQDKYFSQSQRFDAIERIFGNAKDIIPNIDASFDLVFIDADKDNYLNYYHLLIDKLKPGSVILADNVLWSGKVIHPAAPSDIETKTLQEFNNYVHKDERVENILLPIRDGLMMLRKK
ncbi:MAG: O-methyltransferase [Flavobacteriales bacterium]|nr:O-methyltransferase [Flavobacteriales bacterium]